jgi:hypothetical protein
MPAHVFRLAQDASVVIAVQSDKNPTGRNLLSQKGNHFPIFAERMRLVQVDELPRHSEAGLFRNAKGRDGDPYGDFIPEARVALLDFLGARQRTGIIVADQELQGWAPGVLPLMKDSDYVGVGPEKIANTLLLLPYLFVSRA